MTKKKTIRAMFIAAALGISTSMIVNAATSKKEAAKEKLSEWGYKLFDYTEDLGETIYEKGVDPAIDKTDQMRFYDIEDLILVIDKYENIFFVNKDSRARWDWNFYYDEEGRSVTEVSKATFKETRKQYFTITDLNVFYTPRTFTNLKTGEITTNYQELDELFLVNIEDENIKYVVYPCPTSLMPEYYVNKAALNGNRLSIKEIKEIEGIFKSYKPLDIKFDQQSHQNPILNRRR